MHMVCFRHSLSKIVTLYENLIGHVDEPQNVHDVHTIWESYKLHCELSIKRRGLVVSHLISTFDCSIFSFDPDPHAYMFTANHICNDMIEQTKCD